MSESEAANMDQELCRSEAKQCLFTLKRFCSFWPFLNGRLWVLGRTLEKCLEDRQVKQMQNEKYLKTNRGVLVLNNLFYKSHYYKDLCPSQS